MTYVSDINYFMGKSGRKGLLGSYNIKKNIPWPYHLTKDIMQAYVSVVLGKGGNLG